MTEDEVRDYLGNAKTLIIVSDGRKGSPHPMPMWFELDQGGCLYCTTFGKSQEVLNRRRDRKATLLVESGEEYAELKGVVIYARCEVSPSRSVWLPRSRTRSARSRFSSRGRRHLRCQRRRQARLLEARDRGAPDKDALVRESRAL